MCWKCNCVKPFEDFARDRTRSDGFHGSCKLCEKARYAEPGFRAAEAIRGSAWRAANRDRRKAQKRKRERMLAGARQAAYVPGHIFARDGWVCYLCDTPTDQDAKVPHPLAATVEHVIPLSKGGADAPHNVRCAHFSCNVRKGYRGEPFDLWLFAMNK